MADPESKLKTGIVRDVRFLEHLTDKGHPEQPGRLESIYSVLADPVFNDRLLDLPPREAVKEEILLVHSPDYLNRLAASGERDFSSLSPDTPASRGSYRAALLAAGGVFEAVDAVLSGALRNVFVSARPPGHHAERSRAMGFCLLNSVALGAAYARAAHALKRVLIVDWDVHHGNGTQHAFERDPSILFFSTHQRPHFPGTGHFTETGMGSGEGFTINVPMRRGYGDAEFAAVYERLLKPAALEFEPELILVSAGFDIHRKDPLGGMNVTSKGFAALTRCLMDLAELTCGGRLVLVLEGGYDLKALSESVDGVLRELSGMTSTSVEETAEKAHRKKTRHVIERCTLVHRHFWKSLRRP